MYQGILKSYDEKRGYGFIQVLHPYFEKDVFIHRTALQAADYDKVLVNDLLAFDIAWGQRGPQAVNVQ